MTIGTRPSRSWAGAGRFQFSVSVHVTNADYPSLAWFSEHWGGHISQGRITPNPALLTGHAKTLFTETVRVWSCSHQLARRFLEEIRPYVKAKRALVANAVEFSDLQTANRWVWNTRVIMPEEMYQRYLAYYERHKALRVKAKHNLGRIVKRSA